MPNQWASEFFWGGMSLKKFKEVLIVPLWRIWFSGTLVWDRVNKISDSFSLESMVQFEEKGSLQGLSALIPGGRGIS